MTGPRIGDKALFQDEAGRKFLGTVMDIRPKVEWHEPELVECTPGYFRWFDPPSGDYVFLATPGWPHMERVPREEFTHRDDNGVWRGYPGLPQGEKP